MLKNVFLKFARLGLKLQKDVDKSLRSLGLSVEGLFLHHVLFEDNCLLHGFYCLTETIFVSFATFSDYKQSFVDVMVVEDSIFNKDHLILQIEGNCQHYCHKAHRSSPDQTVTELITLPPITIPSILNDTILESRYKLKVNSCSKADSYARDINDYDYEISHSATF